MNAMHHLQQSNLFDQNLTDAWSQNIAIERGLLLQVGPSRWVSIGRRQGVSLLTKRVVSEGIHTHEERVSPLPMLPLAVYTYRSNYFVQVLYGLRQNNALKIDVVRLDALLQPEPDLVQTLSTRGFIIEPMPWERLAQCIRQVVQTTNADASLPVHEARAAHWQVKGDFLVPRTTTWKVLRGGQSSERRGGPAAQLRLIQPNT